MSFSPFSTLRAKPGRPSVTRFIHNICSGNRGSGIPNKEKVGKISTEQLRKIAETKFKDLNAYDLEQAEKIIRGTARSMGIEIEDSV